MVTYNNSTDLYGVTSYIVDATAGQGNYTTIAAALTAATAASFAGDIFIRPGTYTENLTLVAGVNLVAWPGDGIAGTVIIKGNCTFSTAGTVVISGIQLQTNSAALVTVSGNAASILNLVNCNLVMATTAIVYSSSSGSSQINLYQCTGNISAGSVTPFDMSSAGVLTVIGCNITNTGASTTSTTMSAGTAVFQNNNFQFAITNSSTGGLTSAYNYYNTAAINTASATIGGSGTNKFSSDVFLAGTASAVSVGGTATFTSCQFSSSNTNAITGAGTLTTIGCQFTGSSHKNNATTTTGSGAGSGITNGVASAAGQIGENISSTYSGVSIGTGGTQAATIAITAGVWIISANFTYGSGTNSSLIGAISLTTANATPIVVGANATSIVSATIGNYLCFPAFPYTVGSTTNIFLNGFTGSGSLSTTGILTATRVG